MCLHQQFGVDIYQDIYYIDNIKGIITMLSEEELVNKAFELVGNLLIVADDATVSATELMMGDFDLDQKTAEKIVETAFERWIKIYYPE